MSVKKKETVVIVVLLVFTTASDALGCVPSSLISRLKNFLFGFTFHSFFLEVLAALGKNTALSSFFNLFFSSLMPPFQRFQHQFGDRVKKNPYILNNAMIISRVTAL